MILIFSGGSVASRKRPIPAPFKDTRRGVISAGGSARKTTSNARICVSRTMFENVAAFLSRFQKSTDNNSDSRCISGLTFFQSVLIPSISFRSHYRISSSATQFLCQIDQLLQVQFTAAKNRHHLDHMAIAAIRYPEVWQSALDKFIEDFE